MGQGGDRTLDQPLVLIDQLDNMQEKENYRQGSDINRVDKEKSTIEQHVPLPQLPRMNFKSS